MSSLERTLIEIVAFLALVGGFALYERHQGAVKCVAAEATVVSQAETKNVIVETAGKVADAKAETTYDDAKAAPLAPLPPVGSLQPAACPSPVPSPRTPPAQSDYRPTIRAPTPPSVVQQGWSAFERSDVQSGKDADDEVTYLESLLATQYKVCTGH